MGEAATMKKVLQKLWPYLVIGLVIRVLFTIPTPFSDAPAFRFWALYLQNHSLVSLFRDLPGGYTPYPPLYYYILYPIGFLIRTTRIENLWQVSELVLRFPTYLSDILITISIYAVGEKLYGEKSARISALFFLFHPGVIMTGTLWGQFDSVVMFLSFFSIFLISKEKYVWSWMILLIGSLTKLQMIPIAPLIAVLSLKQWKKFIKVSPVLFILGILPFMPVIVEQGIPWTIAYFRALPHWYPYTSVYATNVWGVFGFVVSDSLSILGIPLRFLSIALVILLAFGVVTPCITKKHSAQVYFFAALLLFFTFSLWSTRVHSRYIIYMMPFLSLFVRKLPKITLTLSVIIIINLLLPAKGIGIDNLVALLNTQTIIFPTIAINVFLYVLLLVQYHKMITTHS